MSARPTKAQWRMTDEQIADRLATVQHQLRGPRYPTIAEGDAYLAAHPIPPDGFCRDHNDERLIAFQQLVGEHDRRHERLAREQSRLEHVRDYRLWQRMLDTLPVESQDVDASLGAVPDSPTQSMG